MGVNVSHPSFSCELTLVGYEPTMKIWALTCFGSRLLYLDILDLYLRKWLVTASHQK